MQFMWQRIEMSDRFAQTQERNDTVITYKNANMKIKENVYLEVDIAGLSMKTMNMFLKMRISMKV